MRAIFLVTLSVLAVALGEVVEKYDCENVSNSACQVTEVRITPCNLQHSGCVLKRRKEYGISFDYIPNFSTDQMTTTVYKAGVADVAFEQLHDANACEYTTCPAVAGKSQQLNYSLRLAKQLPRGQFIIKWKLWNTANPDQVCCFKTPIEIR